MFIFLYCYTTRKQEKVCIKVNKVAVAMRELKTEADHRDVKPTFLALVCQKVEAAKLSPRPVQVPTFLSTFHHVDGEMSSWTKSAFFY